MLLSVLLLTFAGMSLGHVVPTVPGDNSHYVEGESRYIWMPNGEGDPVLVDLQEPVDAKSVKDATTAGVLNQYWLFTRENRWDPQIITFGSSATLFNSNFSPLKETHVVVHGVNDNGESEGSYIISQAFLATRDVNVIVLDWHELAAAGYLSTVLGVSSVGQHLGNFLIWLVQNTGISWNSIHLVGLGIGAHVVGNAGRTTSGAVRRITGLDPAGPAFGIWNNDTIRPNDGVYVEIIHTDAGNIGLVDAVGTVDFYPNGGNNRQPGCLLSPCSHRRSYDLFASTVHNNHLEGRLCINVEQAQQGQCIGRVALKLGNNVIDKYGSGIFHLTTTNAWPF